MRVVKCSRYGLKQSVNSVQFFGVDRALQRHRNHRRRSGVGRLVVRPAGGAIEGVSRKELDMRNFVSNTFHFD